MSLQVESFEKLAVNPEEDVLKVEFKQTVKGFRIRAKSVMLAEVFSALSKGKHEAVYAPTVKKEQPHMWMLSKVESMNLMNLHKSVRCAWGEDLSWAYKPTLYNFSWLLLTDLKDGIEITFSLPISKEQRKRYQEMLVEFLREIYSTYIQNEEVTLRVWVQRTGAGRVD